MEQKELDGKVWEVSGFVFENEEQAKLAKKEVEGIQYIHDNMNMDNPQMVQEIYQRIMAQELFHTPIGYAYLKELQDYLKGLPGVDASEIPGIPVKDMGLDLDHVAGKEKSGYGDCQQSESRRCRIWNGYKRDYDDYKDGLYGISENE